MLIRVHKSEYKPLKPHAVDGLSVCLDCWSMWMHSDDRGLSVPRMLLDAGDARDVVAYERDMHTEQMIADYKVGEAVNVAINDLPPAQAYALRRSRGITTQWRYPSIDYAATLQAAHEALEGKLRKNIATADKFIL